MVSLETTVLGKSVLRWADGTKNRIGRGESQKPQSRPKKV